MDQLIYVIVLDDGTTVYARGEDKNEAWAKTGFDGQMIDSMTQADFDFRFAIPEVL